MLLMSTCLQWEEWASHFSRTSTVFPFPQSRTFYLELKRDLTVNHLSDPSPLTEEEMGAQRGEVSPKVTQQSLGLVGVKNWLLICHLVSTSGKSL